MCALAIPHSGPAARPPVERSHYATDWRDPEPPTHSARAAMAARAPRRGFTRLEVGALVLFVPAYHVRAAGWRRVVLLALQVAVDRVAEDFRAARVSDYLDAAANAVVI